MTISKYFSKILALSAIIPMGLLADDHFYIGGNAFAAYVPENNFTFSSYEKHINAKIYSLNGTSIKNQHGISAGGSVVAGFMFDNFVQFDGEVGFDMAKTLVAKNTNIPFDASLKSQDSTTQLKAENLGKLTADSVINEADLTKMNVMYGTLNAYVNIMPHKAFTPFVGFGVGFGRYKADMSANEFGSTTVLIASNAGTNTGDHVTTNNNSIKLQKLLDSTDTISMLLNCTLGFSVISDHSIISLGYRLSGSANNISLEIDSDSDNGNDTSYTNRVGHKYMRHNAILSIKFLS